MLRHLLFSSIVILLGSAALAAAQEMPVPVDVQYNLLLKVLSFDRNLKLAEKETLNIGVVYQRGFRTSLRTKEDFVAVAEREIQKLKTPRVKIILVDLKGEDDIAAAILTGKIDVLYISPLRATSLEHIVASARATHTLTLTGVPEFMDEGVTVGIGHSDGKPQIVINLEGAKEVGADFTSQLLKLAKIVR